jgi:hypothetical protein
LLHFNNGLDKGYMRWLPFAQALLLVLLFWWNAPRFWYDFGPDFVSYVSIARHYQDGDWANAVNTWWSPLYSWLLAIMLKIFPDPLLANKLLQLLFALAGWYAFRSLLRFHLNDKKSILTECLLFASVPFWVYWALRSDTPDLLSAVLLLCFLGCVLRLHTHTQLRLLVLTGVCAALAYLAKAFNFYVVVAVSLLIVCRALWVTKKRAAIFRNSIRIMAVFVCMCFLWMLAMFGRNKKWQVSGIAMHTPCAAMLLDSMTRPVEVYDCAGLQLQAGNRISNWETPAVYGSTGFTPYLRTHGVARVANNLRLYFTQFSSTYLWLLLAVLLLLVGGSLRLWWLYGAFLGVYVGGYALFHLEARFFIVTGALQMLLVIVLLNNLLQPHLAAKAFQWLAVLAVCFLFARWPMAKLFHFNRNTLPAQMAHWVNDNKNIIEPARQGNLAADAGLFEEGLYVAFFTEMRFYGALQKRFSDDMQTATFQFDHQKIGWFLEKLPGSNRYIMRPAKVMAYPTQR